MTLKRLGEGISRRVYLQRKAIYQWIRSHVDKSYMSRRRILLIVGCQRSGTSSMLHIFERDRNAKAYGENSKLSSLSGLRLDPLDRVKREIQKDKAPLVVMKPLVESQNIPQLLEYFEGSKALWMYRNYRDVASSSLRQFGIRNGINDLRPIVENQPKNWRSEKASDDTKKTIGKYFSENMNPYDAAVLFWFARNSLFFELGLDKNPNVLMCRYEDMIMAPAEVVGKIYGDLGLSFPGEKITGKIHSSSFKKGKDIGLSPEIDQLAREMLDRLDKAYHVKNG